MKEALVTRCPVCRQLVQVEVWLRYVSAVPRTRRDFAGICGHCWADYGNSKSWRRVLGRERSNGSAVA